ncbi:YihY/virulence factor BrkB family protein [Haloferula sp. BvORR071]|uniref:YihY/virulence factor BrkB family protein n=1 Tax=Haloferula sp. BvORR071 TaxID=1396141 RepID=UPI0005516827|nr:YihY/virulence factor BrkB family protein [Haloferula sp. BvORR071]
MNPREEWLTLRQTFTEFQEDNALRLSAALAYYSAFSIAPILLIAIAVAGMVAGDEAVRGSLSTELRSSLGPTGALVVEDMIAHAWQKDRNAWSAVIGVIMLLFGAGGVFGQLQEALNTVWGVKAKPGQGFVRILKDRFISYAMVLGTGFLLLTSMLLTAAIDAASKYAASHLPVAPQLWYLANLASSFAIITGLFAAIFKVMPDVKLGYRDVITGAAFTAFLFVAGKTAIGWYLGRESTASPYGSAGALALVLLWVYYSAIILLFGAEFTQVRAGRRGKKIEPTPNAREREPEVAGPEK